MAAEGGIVEVEVRVRFGETDRYDVAHSSCYLTWFELARVELLRACGLTIRDFDQAGVLIPVREFSAKLLAPIRYDDLIVVRARLAELTLLKIGISYEIVARDEVGSTELAEVRMLATGTTLNVSVNTATGRPTKLPAALFDALKTLYAPLAP
ncbi:MAG: acyl-CoA thioesterase [Verrucomicrobia bacterium]|nr:acyl-CoA thioesterase [Verrucomicrobiota bacterium]